jgi:hypothetical protein
LRLSHQASRNRHRDTLAVDISRTARTWAGQIAEMLLPRGLFTPGLPKAAPVEIRISTLPLDEVPRQAARKARRPLSLLLDPALCLRRRVDLPKAVGAKSDAAIALQLRQTLPGQGHGLIWRATATGRTATQIEYTVHILRQTQIDELVADVRALGAEVAEIKVAVPGLEPLWQRSAGAARTAKTWMAFSALSVAVIGLAAVVGIELKRQELDDLVSSRSARTAALEERLLAKRAEAETGKVSSAGILNDMALFSDQARRLQILADLTAAVPDTVWISELSISGDKLVLSGFTAGKVTEVITKVQLLPWASNVQLNGAISYDSYSGQNRFELGMTLVMDGAT